MALPLDASRAAAPLLAAGDRQSGRAVRQLAALASLTEALRREGIPFLILKGMVEAVANWHNPALRGAQDIDLFIPPSQAWRVWAVLQDLGYSPRDSLECLGVQGLNSSELKFHHQERQILLELHWRFSHSPALFSPTIDAMLPSRCEVPFHALSLPTLPKTERFLYLCAHGCGHGWAKLVWLSDVAETLRTMDDAEARRILETATRLGMVRQVSVAAALAETLLGAPRPAVLPIPDRAARHLFRRAVHDMLTAPEHVHSAHYLSRWRLLRESLLYADGPGAWGLVLATMLAPGQMEYLACRRLPPSARGIAMRLLRWGRLLRHLWPGAPPEKAS